MGLRKRMEPPLVVRRWSLAETQNPSSVLGSRSSAGELLDSKTWGRLLREITPSTALADDRRPKTEYYFNVAANCRTVLMNVSVARVRVRSRR